MTTRELRNEVSSLCYTDIGEKDLRFITYSNLALRAIYNEFNIVGEHRIDLGEKPLYYTEKILHTGGQTQKLSLTGKAFSMILSGKGCVTVTDQNGDVRKSFDTEETAFCGFLTGEASLTVEGNDSCVICHLACFGEDFGGDISKIRFVKPTLVYSMREETGNFHSFIAPPTDKYGTPLSELKLIDDRIILDGKRFGEINLFYRRLPKRIFADLQDEWIDVPESYEELLTLLCTYFILLEDERDRANYFKELYNEVLKEKKNNTYERIGDEYFDTNGWA